jgi:hypothetical protein
MDVLTLGEKKYVKASVIARDLGYTADYVGQLCRAGKVDAKLFGRSWYVNKDSIGDHKSTRYRSTQAKSVQAVRVHLEETTQTKAYKKDLGHSLFYTHNRQKPSPRYVPDESPLIPDTKKTGTLQIGLAEAATVKIESSDDTYAFKAPKLPVVKFKGALALSEFEEAEAVIPEGTTVIHAKEVTTFKSKKKANNKVISAKEVATFKSGTHQVVPIEIDAPYVTERVFLKNSPVASSFPFDIIVSTVVSLAFLVVLIGLESHISSSSQNLVSNYKFNFGPLLASVSDATLENKSLLTTN